MKKTFSLLLTAVLLSGLCLPAMAADYNNNYHEPGSQIYVTIPIHRDSGIWDFDGYFELTRGLEWVRTYTIPEKFLKKATSTTFYGTFIGVRENPDINPVKDIWLTVIVKIKENATPVQEFYCPAIWTCNSPNSSADTEATVTHFRFPIPVRPSLDHLLPGLPPDPPAGALPETEDIPDIPVIPLPTVYPNNTMCIMGPRLRDIAPGSTDKWYMVTPVDISQEGEQTFPLVASNIYRVGTATVAVKEGQLTVTYKTLKGVTVHSEHLAIYPDLETAVKQNAAGLDGVSFKPGEPISIADDLAGDTSVLLLMCNRVTYDTDVNGLSVFRPGADDVKDVLEQMQEMIR
jgi:hypothetical protein